MSIRRTFPIDRERLKKEKLKLFAKSPLTIGAAAGGLVLLVSLPLNILAQAILVLGVGYGLHRYWKSSDDRLESEVLAFLIEESNKQQDEALRESMTQLQKMGRHNYSVTLGRFLILKQAIEARLHEDEKVTQAKRELENLVDEICFSVKENIFRIIEIEERTASILVSQNAHELVETNSTRRELLNQIVHSFDVIDDTYMNLETLLQPGQFSESQEAPIEKMIHRLKAENELARSVQARLDSVESMTNETRPREMLPE